MKKPVYLDIDNLYTYDYQCSGIRLVCVVYVSHNSTHYLNVNKALHVNGYTQIKDYDNEFNPYTWTFYKSKNMPTSLTPTVTPKLSTTSPTLLAKIEFQITIMSILMLLLILLVILIKRKKL